MKLSELKMALRKAPGLCFVLADGTPVPAHFHVTEVGVNSRKFIDCGGVMREEAFISLQLWYADDLTHRLSSNKLLSIIQLAEKSLMLEDLEVEVEFQMETIGRYHLGYDQDKFLLKPTSTACLAADKCGVPCQKPKIRLSQSGGLNLCTPGNGCC